MAKNDLVLVKSVRTPIGKFQGSLRDLSPKEMGTIVVSDLLAQTGIDPEIVDGIIVGWAAQDYTTTDIAREVGLAAGLPDTIVGTTVHRNCGTGMEALDYARIRIKAGAVDAAIGCEDFQSALRQLLIVKREPIEGRSPRGFGQQVHLPRD